MIGVCLIVAGAVRAAVPVDEFTLGWWHSVEKTRWEERYRVDGDRLRLVEARVAASGAGMEPAPDAVLRDGMWTWQPGTTRGELRLTWSSFTADYELCAQGRCAPLARWTGALGEGDAVTLRACPTQ